jgi:hypothetical protein
MTVTVWTWTVAVGGLVLITLLSALQVMALVRPRSKWTISNVYGGDPSSTDPVAYFAFNQGSAWADVFLWAPLQIAGSVGMLLGERWGFLLALVASVPYWYTAVYFFIWDRDLGFRQRTATYWILTWGIWPAFGVLESTYCFARLVT